MPKGIYLHKKGTIPWNKGIKGLVKSNSGSFKKGNSPWNKNTKGIIKSWNKGKTGIYSEETIEKMRIAKLNRKLSKKIKLKMSESAKKYNTLEIRKKKSEEHKGEKSHFWRGGITPLNFLIRSSAEYKNWRRKVFEQDNFTCQHCGIRGGEIQADHIKPFSLYPELRFELSNGRTLCKSCHLKTDTWGGRIQLKLPQQIQGQPQIAVNQI